MHPQPANSRVHWQSAPPSRGFRGTCGMNVLNKHQTLPTDLVFTRFFHLENLRPECKQKSDPTKGLAFPTFLSCESICFWKMDIPVNRWNRTPIFFPSAHIIHTPTVIIIHMWLCKHVCVCVCPISMTLIPDRTETLPTGRSRRACSKNAINTSLRGRERA